jgi:tetratricopeptide (TPR) repeat protein
MRFAPSIASALLLAALPVAGQEEGPHVHGSGPAPSRGRSLGITHFETSCNPAVAADFDRAVALLHSFEYDEARDAFAAVAEKDPKCAMAKWGEAMTRFHGLWSRYHGQAGAEAAAEARRRASENPATTDREKAYIAAISEVFGDEALKASRREDNAPDVQGYSEPARAPQVAYTEKMAALHAAYPDDVEAAVFYALALNVTMKRDDPTHASLRECVALLKPLFAKLPDHPGIAHYLVHCTDNPEMAPEGLEAARKYAAIAPASAHATHMPSHIFAQLGLWDEMVQSNRASLKAAEEDVHQSACQRLGHTLHARYYLSFALLETGQRREALKVAERGRHVPAGEKCDEEPTLPLAGYILETGEWQRAADVAVQGRAVPIVEGGLWMTIGIAAARTGDRARAQLAEQKLAALRDARARRPGGTVNNGIEAVRLAVAGWIAHEAGRKDEAAKMLREAADLQDRLRTGNSVLKPVRELLADMLMRDGRPAEALAEYRAVLERQPNRFNSVFGAGSAADASGDAETARRYYADLVRFARGAERAELVTARKRLGGAITVGDRQPRPSR